MSTHPRIVSVATAVPPDRVDQDKARERAQKIYRKKRKISYIDRVFRRVGVEYRYLSEPLDFYGSDSTWAERNALYERRAKDLAAQAIQKAISGAGIESSEVDALYVSSCTGFLVPGLDPEIMDRCNLRSDVDYYPFSARGCSGGAAAIAQASHYLRAYPDRVALAAGAEVCSLAMIPDETDKTDVVGAALFGDGAGAALLVGDNRPEAGLQLLGSSTTTWVDQRELMGWDVVSGGLKLVLSTSLPEHLRESSARALETACRAVGVDADELKHYVLHPGGPAVLAALEDGLGLSTDQTRLSREVLNQYGNMSSATVFFVLERFIQSTRYEPGDLALLAAMGPGFSQESIFLRNGVAAA